MTTPMLQTYLVVRGGGGGWGEILLFPFPETHASPHMSPWPLQINMFSMKVFHISIIQPDIHITTGQVDCEVSENINDSSQHFGTESR